jgi:hypothetical protein
LVEGGRHAVGGDRLLIWSGLDAWRVEVARVELSAGGIHASGTQIGLDPVPYRLDYRLAAPERFVTGRLDVEAAGSGWRRWLELRRDADGGWDCEAGGEGRVDLPSAGGDVESLRGALDCDLGLSPLTNTMPVRRHGLDREPGAVDFLMAWVSAPDLGLQSSRQRYEHVRAEDGRRFVRYVDLGTHRGFEAELELDADGLVVRYPELARRVDGAGAGEAAEAREEAGGGDGEQKRDADEVA